MQKDWWQPPAGHHRYCIRHVLSNYKKTFKNAAIKEALRKATNENQKRKFYETINNIREVHHESYNWAVKINLDKWTRSHDGGQRYGVMTKNMAKSLNGMMKRFRALPITAMVEKIFFQQKQVVKLMDQTCTCGKFQELRIPCFHAIAACMSHSIDYEQFVSEYYKLDSTIQCYAYTFHPLGHPDYWPAADGLPLVPDISRTRKKGQPRSPRIRNEMDWRSNKIKETSRVHCSICGRVEHNKKICMGGELGR
ncbi:uncharacterized protein LOC110604884 [Manihot esculenta]|uniref:uncharacterized protein LOC110604884 n=1 Tax=Manihot esculenta TaxID=3983 RepID=UPI000B5D0882|nr:uncharacterized protein LOC110604884 [Manihot esculenta]